MANKEIRVVYRSVLKDETDVSRVAKQIRDFLRKLHQQHGQGPQRITISTKDDNEE